jgi:hypothetical protein
MHHSLAQRSDHLVRIQKRRYRAHRSQHLCVGLVQILDNRGDYLGALGRDLPGLVLEFWL